MQEIISSTSNPKVRTLKKLKITKYIKSSGTFIIENPKVIEEAKNANLIEEIITTNPAKKGTLVTKAIMSNIVDTKNPSDVIAVCKIPQMESKGQKVLVLNNVQDPGNVGTLIRTAVAFGFDTVVVEGAYPFSQKVSRSSQGALFKTSILDIKAIDYLKEFKGQIISTAILENKSKKYDEIDIQKPFCVVLGNEGRGIEEEILSMSNEIVYIPIDFESLNVAQAGAILLNQYK